MKWKWILLYSVVIIISIEETIITAQTERPKMLEKAVYEIIKEIYENIDDDLLYVEFIKVDNCTATTTTTTTLTTASTMSTSTTTTTTITTTATATTTNGPKLEKAVFKIIKELYEIIDDDLLYIEFIKDNNFTTTTTTTTTKTTSTLIIL